jgi:hypothetical protein
MKTITFRIATLAACLFQGGCVSAMLKTGASTSGEPLNPAEQAAGAAVDIVTAPIQLPLLLVLDPPSLAGKQFPVQSEEEKEAVRQSQQRERMRRISGY